MSKLSFALLGACMAAVSSTSSVLASDLDQPPPVAYAEGNGDDEGAWYGNLHGTLGSDISTTGTAVIIPYANVGGKAAYERGVGAIGAQIDFDGWYQDLAWASPAYTTIAGYSGQGEAAAHITYLVDEDKKLGAFVAYDHFNRYLKDLPTGDNAYINTGMVGLGLEGLWVASDETYVQLRAAAFSRVLNQTTATIGGATTTTGGLSLGFNDIGFVGSAAANQQLSDNFSMRADVGYAAAHYNSTGSDWSGYGALAGLQYTFDGDPLSVAWQVGYMSQTSGGVTGNSITTGAKVTYSFGGPSSGAEGKLFRSGMLNFFF